jgi:hypothetical protein
LFVDKGILAKEEFLEMVKEVSLETKRERR